MRGLFGRFVAILLMLVLAPAPAMAAPAQTDWRQARTDHFILTINDTEQGARDFATRLERFDAALRRLYGVSDGPDKRARPIAIYAWKADLYSRVCGCPPGVLGFYRNRMAGSYVFTFHMPDADRKSKTGSWSSQTLLLHEYSHHFTFSNFPVAYPYWFAEGFAEFNAASSFEEDGSVIIGYPANYRADALKNGGGLSPKQLFDPHRYGFVDNIDLVYGRGWLLTHYLMLNPQRNAQLSVYLKEMNKGKLSLDAAQAAFGDLKKLNAELDAYRRGKLAAPLRIPPAATAPSVTVTTLSPGQAEILPVRAALLNGVAKGYGLSVASRAAKVAGRYPDDAEVQVLWAEAEQVAGRLDRADEAADKALKLKPDMVEALTRKGQIMAARAIAAKTPDPAQWTAARAWFLKANRINPDAVAPLFNYYVSFTAAKAKPTPGAVKALMRAQVLAPESEAVRMVLARQMLTDGDSADARALLQPAAFSPHRPIEQNVPREVIDLIDAGKIDEAKVAIMKGVIGDD